MPPRKLIPLVSNKWGIDTSGKGALELTCAEGVEGLVGDCGRQGEDFLDPSVKCGRRQGNGVEVTEVGVIVQRQH